ncbi:MAG: hypothetical protein ACJAU4_001514, partial [Glaciecola sp.]
MLVGLSIFATNLMSEEFKGPASFIANKQVQSGMIDIMHDATTDTVYLRLDKNQLTDTFIFHSSLPQGIGSNDIGLD